MKRLLLFFALVGWCPSLFAGYSHISTAVSAQSGNNNDVTTASRNITGADLVVCVVASYLHQPTNGDVTDSQMNTYVVDAAFENVTNGVWVATFSSRVTATGSTTFTYSFTGSFPAIACQAYAGSTGSPLDGTPVGANADSGASLATGSFTPAASELCTVGAAWGNNNQTTSYTSFTKITEQPNAGAELGIAMADNLACSGAQNETVTWASSVTGIAVDLVSYKAAAGGGSSCTTRKLLLGVGPC